jgi:MoaA/NifB/PqqE/SkfB family radical SAM enzyme
MRVLVSHACSPRCPSCATCIGAGDAPGAEETPGVDAAPSAAAVLAAVADCTDEIVLGGGDAVAWPGLDAFLAAPRRCPTWVEASARAFSPSVPERLAVRGVAGIVVHVDATGPRLAPIQIVGAAESTIAIARRHGLGIRVRLRLRPTMLRVLILAVQRFAPLPVSLEVLRHDHGGAPAPIPPESVAGVFRHATNAVFAGDRTRTRGFLPPCTLRSLYRDRPAIWAETLAPSGARNACFEACASCGIADRCRFDDPGAIADAAQVQPIEVQVRYPAAHRTDGVTCVAPWTNLMVFDLNGDATQCCSGWTVGSRGNRFESSLSDIWNGNGYRSARRFMKRGPVSGLCRPICPRLYDRMHEETRFVIRPGSAAYVRNQEIMAEDIAEGREDVRSLPLTLGFAMSSYCNYDCIMCAYGRTPRRDLPADIWDELPAFMPTLRTLTFTGGEPLADAGVMQFLRDFDPVRWPDAGVSMTTNGSLLTPKALAHLRKCVFSDITVSLNAGTPEVYEKVQRGLPLETVLTNLDALLAFRTEHKRPFDVRLGFVVQPTSAHTLIAFGEIAASRQVRIRLLPLSTEGNAHLDFYRDADAVARLVEHIDRFEAWARVREPRYLEEIQTNRAAILGRATTGHLHREVAGEVFTPPPR